MSGEYASMALEGGSLDRPRDVTDEATAAPVTEPEAMEVGCDEVNIGSDQMDTCGVQPVTEHGSGGTLADPACDSLHCQSHGRGAGPHACTSTLCI